MGSTMEEKDFSLRPATAEDMPAIRGLIQEGNINPIGLAWPRFTVAVDPAGQVIGCGQIKPHAGGVYELASIAVRPAWRRQGVARCIIDHLLSAHFTVAPETPLYLTCRSELGSFYTRFGFRPLTPEEMPPYFRRIYRVIRIANALRLLPRGLLVMGR